MELHICKESTMAATKPRQQPPKTIQQPRSESENEAFAFEPSPELEQPNSESEAPETMDWNSAGLRRKRPPWD
jgi:hypothetical protein